MAFKFDLVKANDSRQVGYYGFAWSALLLGPLAPLMRRDFSNSFLLMLGEVLVCAVVFLFDHDPLLLIARLGVITFIWALLYNELYTLGLMASGFSVEGSHEVVSALEGRFPAEGRADRIRLLRERCLVLVVLGLGGLQVIASVPNSLFGSFNLARQSPPAKSASSESAVARVTPAPTPAPTPTSTPISTPTPSPPAIPRVPETPQLPPISIPSPTPIPRATESPRPPAKSPAVVLGEQQRACDAAMGSQFDSDLPPGARYLADTNVLSEADIDQAIASCVAARAGPGRRFSTQLGRAYAARAVMLASKGSDADARDYMNKAIAQWNAAATQGSGAALNFLGAVYKGTFNSPTFTFFKDYSKALEYWLRGDAAGNLKAARNAGGMLLLGPEEFPGVAQDIGKARELLIKAIGGGDMTAASLYGQALFYGYPPGVGKNHVADGLEYLKKACSFGDPSAKAFFDTEYAKPKRSPALLAPRPPGC